MPSGDPRPSSTAAVPARTPPPAGGVVRVFAPPGPERRAVVSWARRHARRTGARLEILVDPALPAPRSGAVAVLGRVLVGAIRVLVGGTALVDRLARAAAGARMLVVPQRLPGVDELVDDAYEPVTVVPDDPPHTRGPVVLALAPRTSDETVEAAFDAAASRGSPLLAVSVRAHGWVPAAGDDETGALDEERRDRRERLAAWCLAYPQVPVEVQLDEGDPALALLDLSSRARLLVLGRSARGRVLGTVTPSPVAAVTRRARCPVLVVPPPGPPRHSWWPRSS
ncbi:MAG: hypothetical protein K0S40_1816 [Actinomycetospora sp.]|jgi:nucleotide-binding universal stress UspA family protein|nr:hypothetical protein [Actinomycetospora sp.]